MLERLDRARRQFFVSGMRNLVDLRRRNALAGGWRTKPSPSDDLVKIDDLLEQPTEAWLGMRRKWEDDQELSRAEWDVLVRYAEKGCEQHGFSSDSGLPSRESFAQLLEAFLAVWSLRSGENPQLDNFYRRHLEHSQSDRYTLPEVVQAIIVDIRQSSGTTGTLYAARLPQGRARSGTAGARRQCPSCATAVSAVPLSPGDMRPLAGRKAPDSPQAATGAAPDWLPTFVPDVTDEDFVLSTVVRPDEGELYMELQLNPLGISFWLGPYPDIREFTKMIAYLAPGRSWRGRHFKAGEESRDEFLDERIRGKNSFRFNGVRLWLTPKERAAIGSVFKQAMQLPQVQTTLADLELEYGEV
jgi:hypothetical protein